jgi:hypothetical protein
MVTTKSTISPQLSERVAIVETKVDAMIVCIDEIKINIRDMHDCLDKTRETVLDELKIMNSLSTEQHEKLTNKVSELEKFKTKGVYLAMGAVAALGWAAGHTAALGLFK